MSSHNMRCKIFHPPHTLPIYYCGPMIDQGPLPAIFYFALSGEDSLILDPYNQPVSYLADKPLRIFSMTIPGHGDGLDNHLAMQFWARHIYSGENLITKFITECRHAMDFLESEGCIESGKVAAAGLSRGSFIGAHLAAQDKRIKTLLCFAPLTRLDALDEFQENSILADQLSVMNLIKNLTDTTIRCYIGNRDTRVNTDYCYTWIRQLSDAAYEQRHRSPPMELMIYPSIGHRGHGTPVHIFHEGADWLMNRLHVH